MRPPRCSRFRAAACGLLLVAALQLLYLALLPGLQAGPRPRRRKPDLPAQAADSRRALSRSLEQGGRPDDSGRYRLYPDVTRCPVAGRWGLGEAQWGLALATHASANNLHHLPGLVRRWRAPISLALFSTAYDLAEALQALHLLSLHCPGVRDLVVVTLVTPAHVAAPSRWAEGARDEAWEPGPGPEAEPEPDPACRRALGPVHRLSSRYANYGLANASYPGNLLRNAARRALPARYVAVIDVDMLPSAGLYRRLLGLVSGPGPGLTVYVLPALEMRRSRRVPTDKSEVQRLYQVGEVRPFYAELCPRCQAPTNYSRWINLAAGPGLRVAYTLAWSDPWEPFYLGPASVPAYDPRFEQYGFNRISQACELHVAGYSFAVLDNAFLIHKGFKLTGEFHPRKDEENRRNRILFRHFKQELRAKYPESTRRC
ncbi:beta-1,4-glucuronyltransferase 1 isoform X2 [Narcine bancroftii]|uniref:beta-1,4-glucuronyltransferase 1 isoform X2 n=1 Tax=Narcine bancroftii TaxID=1343680 RepID=UPI0038318715